MKDKLIPLDNPVLTINGEVFPLNGADNLDLMVNPELVEGNDEEENE